jgi:hypothetical protein
MVGVQKFSVLTSNHPGDRVPSQGKKQHLYLIFNSKHLENQHHQLPSSFVETKTLPIYPKHPPHPSFEITFDIHTRLELDLFLLQGPRKHAKQFRSTRPRGS